MNQIRVLEEWITGLCPGNTEELCLLGYQSLVGILSRGWCEGEI